MASGSLTLQSQIRPFASAKASSNRSAKIRAITCSAQPQRRDVLTLGLASVILPQIITTNPALAASNDMFDEREVPVTALNVFQKASIIESLQKRSENVLKSILTAEDAPAAVRLLLNDAAAGGVNGSIVNELDRPENKDLKPLVTRLAEARKSIDAGAPKGQGPITWADTIVLAAKVATEQQWEAIKVERAGGNRDSSGAKYGASWAIPLGRTDATSADAGSAPKLDAAPSDVLAFFKNLGLPAGGVPEGRKPPFWERQTFVLWSASRPDPAAAEAELAAANPDFEKYKKKYDVSRKTFTRTDYEVDFIEYLNKLADVGAKYNKDQYYHPFYLSVPKKL